uniref:J domain-containing protein n=1 Tax=Macrostomum lignano TaxID=282301 RepID=A0A1I8IDE8_9PLAT
MASASNASGSEPPNSERKFSTSGESLYQILGLEKGASSEQVKKAYRKIKELNRANHVLSDEKRKAIYDKYGSVGLQIASQIGEDNVTTYFMLDNVCC